jgi:sulfatase maturation enzyme AslB (radical SAM superfamily)
VTFTHAKKRDEAAGEERTREGALISTMREAPPAFHLLAKPTEAVCNLDCSYCLCLSKDMLYPTVHAANAGHGREV